MKKENLIDALPGNVCGIVYLNLVQNQRLLDALFISLTNEENDWPGQQYELYFAHCRFIITLKFHLCHEIKLSVLNLQLVK